MPSPSPSTPAGRASPSVVCVGSALQDVFLQDRMFTAHHERDGEFQEFRQGSKNQVEDITFAVGGGATNAAVTFARHGLATSVLGRIGEDHAGAAVTAALEADGVSTDLLLRSPRLRTGYSTVLLSPDGERTILTYRGASAHFGFTAAELRGRRPTWLYVCSLGGDLETLAVILDHARRHGIAVAANPGLGELRQRTALEPHLRELSMLSLNREEARMVFRGDDVDALAASAGAVVPVALITDGPNGAAACVDGVVHRVGIYRDVRVVDRTGAGDAFTSGFLASRLAGAAVPEALTWAGANATSVIQQVGAKAGILRSGPLGGVGPVDHVGGGQAG